MGSSANDSKINEASHLPDQLDAKSVTKLLMESQNSLYAFIYSLLGRSDEAYDVLQETNIALLEKEEQYDQTRSFMTWACRFAHLQVLAHRGRQTRDRHRFDDELVNMLALEMGKEVPNSDSRLKQLSRCIQRLPTRHQWLIVQHYELGIPYDEIGKKLGKTVNALTVSMSRVRRKLHECMRYRIAEEEAG